MSSSMYQFYSNDAIIIPPLELVVDSGRYTCSGHGLLKDGYKFDPDFDKFLPPLKALKTNAGAVEVVEPKIQEQTLAYWRAQCAFRNLVQKATIEDLEIEDLQKRLRKGNGEGKVGMYWELAMAEESLNKEFWRTNAVAGKAIWDGSAQKVDRFLIDKFRDLLLSVPVVTLKADKDDRLRLHRAAFFSGYFAETVDAPQRAVMRKLDCDKLVVIGPYQSDVRKETQRICRNATQIRQRLQDSKNERIEMLYDRLLLEAKSRPSWNVCGLWAISCPSIENSLNYVVECLLDIQCESRCRHDSDLWAKFNFITIRGIFEFMKPEFFPRFGPSQKLSDDGEDQYICNDHLCYFCSNNEVTPYDPMRYYSWRGEEQSDRKAVHSEGKLGSITFDMHGTALTGVFFYNDGEIRFTGRKIGPISKLSTA